MGECVATLRIKDNGDFEFKPHNKKSFDRIMNKINPIRKAFWNNHIKQKITKS